MFVFRHNLLLEHLVDGCQFLMSNRVAVGAEQGHDQRLDGRMGGPESVRGHAGINDVHTGLDSLQVLIDAIPE